MAGSAELEALRARAYAGLVTLVDRAQAAGALRADFRHEDVVLLLMANAGLLERTCEAAPGAWDRHLSLVLDGLRAEAATPAAPTPGPQRVQRAMKAAPNASAAPDRGTSGRRRRSGGTTGRG